MKPSHSLSVLVLLALSVSAAAAADKGGIARTDRFGDPLPPGAIARLGTLRFRLGSGRIIALRFSPDGRKLLSVERSDRGRIWRAATGEEQGCFLFSLSNGWALTPDCLLVARANGPSIHVSETRSGRTVRELTIPNHTVTRLCLSPDGKTLVAWAIHETTKQSFFRVWGLPGGPEHRDITVARREGEKEFSADDFFFTAEGKILVAEMTHEESKAVVFRRWDFRTGQELPAPIGRLRPDQMPTFAPDGKLLAVGVKGAGKAITVWLLDAATGATRRDLGPAMSGRLFGMRFSPDGRWLLAVAEQDGGDAVRLWEVSSGKPLPAPAAGPLWIKDVIFAPDGGTIAIQEEGAIHLCQTANGKRLHELKTSYPGDEMRQTGITPPKSLSRRSVLAFALDGKLLAAAPNGRLIRRWETVTGKEIKPVDAGHECSVDAVAFAPDGKTVASVGGEGIVRLWEAATGREVRVLPLAGTGDRLDSVWEVGRYRVTFLPRSQTVAAVGLFNVVQLWDTNTGTPRGQFSLPQGGVRSLVATPDGKTLITGGQGRVLFWDPRTGRPLHRAAALDLSDLRKPRDEENPLNLAVSPDGRLLAVTSERLTGGVKQRGVRELRLCELATGKLRRRIPDDAAVKRLVERRRRVADWSYQTNGPLIVAFAPDGKTLAWNSGEAVEVVDVARGVPLRHLGPPPETTLGMAYSPTGGLLAVAVADDAVRLLDPASGALRGHIEGQRGNLYCLAFSPDGRMLATAGSDTTVLLWDVPRILKAWQDRLQPRASADPDTLWRRLASADGTEAAEAMAQLQTMPRQAVMLLHERLRPAPPVDVPRMARLLNDLDSDQFAVRKRAVAELEQLAELAEPSLRKRLADKPSLEVRRAVEDLLARLDGPIQFPEQRRGLRAVEVLEYLGTADARVVLRGLARGAPEARLTREAKAALERLARHPSAP